MLSRSHVNLHIILRRENPQPRPTPVHRRRRRLALALERKRELVQHVGRQRLHLITREDAARAVRGTAPEGQKAGSCGQLDVVFCLRFVATCDVDSPLCKRSGVLSL
jgi:hypothetical protein